MATVETVTGAVDVEALGTTLIHEHLRARDESNAEQFPHLYDDDALYAAAVEAARGALDRGVRTICEPTAMLLGRDAAFMERVARETGLQVVACTGIYTYDHLPLFWQSRSEDQMADAFVHDIEQGIQGTAVKAGFLKCAADAPGVTPNVEKVHRACARASLRTGRPIMAHSRPASDTAPRQIEILLEEGVAPEKIQIAHMGDTDDLDQIERVLDTGVWIGLDRYGIEMYLPTERRNATTLALLERGHAGRLFIAADSCASLDWFDEATVAQLLEHGAVRDWSITLTHDQVVPALLEGGMTEAQVTTVFEENPRRWLAG